MENNYHIMSAKDNRPIGVFDSGLGGLTTVACITELLPEETFVYFGDTARTPYGSKSIETIKRFSAQISDFLVEHDAKMVVVACNTVSAICLDLLRERHPEIPIIGMIKPTAKEIAENYSGTGIIGIIGTSVTVESRQYEEEIKAINRNIPIKAKACPLFVPVIEEGIADNSVLESVIRYYLDDLIRDYQIDTLVLGCTHYPLIQQQIEGLYPKLSILNPSEAVAREVKRQLEASTMLAEKTNNQNHFYASDLSDEFVQMVKRILEDNVSIKCKEFLHG